MNQLWIQQNQVDSSLFIQQRSTFTMLMLVYVDDTILTGSPDAPLDALVQSFHKEFAMTGLGTLNYFLGIEAHFSYSLLLLTQSKYIHGLLHWCNMDSAKPMNTPVVVSSKPRPDDAKRFSNPSKYHSCGCGIFQEAFRPCRFVCVTLFIYDSTTPRMSESLWSLLSVRFCWSLRCLERRDVDVDSATSSQC